MAPSRMPVAFVCHGAGPMPVTRPAQQGGLPDHLRALGKSVRAAQPKAILVVSAHWEPELLYDYYGFEPEAYKLQYRAPGAVELAATVCDRLRSDGMQAELVTGRGWDHGVFIPLLLMLEAADIPILQVSLLKALDPAAHLRLGQSLASLRDQGVFILGSGMSYHNMRGFGKAEGASKRFHDWLTPVLCNVSPEKRVESLTAWQQAPAARECHPREEHLLPLHVCAGAAGLDKGQVVYSDVLMGVHVASYVFGDWHACAL